MKSFTKEKVDLPDGLYDALWSGSKLEILIPNKEIVFAKTHIAVKGINCKTKLEIKKGIVNILK